MLTCLKCLKTTEPQIIVVERSNRYPLCDNCGVSMVDLIERMPLEVVKAESEDTPDPPVNKGEITEVKPKAKKKKSK